jgi:hypothetical protein
MFSGINTVQAQARKHYKGSHSYNKRRSSGARRNKSYKNMNKSSRNKVKRRQSSAHRSYKASTKKRTSIARVSKSSKNHKSKHFKGKYPNSKHQFGTKLEVFVSAGAVLNNTVSTNTNEFITEGSTESKSGYHLSLGLVYHLGNHLGIYTDVHKSRIPKENSFIDLTGGGLYAKWNFTSYKKKVSLYAFGGVSFDNWNYEYRDFTGDVAFTNCVNQDFATVTVVEQKYEKYQSSSEIMIGTKFGLGLDFQVSRNVGAFLQFGYAQNQNQEFNFNVSNVTFDVGLKIALLKNKSLY